MQKDLYVCMCTATTTTKTATKLKCASTLLPILILLMLVFFGFCCCVCFFRASFCWMRRTESEDRPNSKWLAGEHIAAYKLTHSIRRQPNMEIVEDSRVRELVRWTCLLVSLLLGYWPYCRSRVTVLSVSLILFVMSKCEERRNQVLGDRINIKRIS